MFLSENISIPHLPDTDEVVGVTGEQCLTISRPGQGGHLGRLGSGAARDLGPKVLHLVLALQVPDLDGGSGGGTQPVPEISYGCKYLLLIGQ